LCEKPNNAIYKFEGTIAIPRQSEMIPLNTDNMLLRGMSVRNTDYVQGIVIFTGHDTKVMQNSAHAKYKFSRLENKINFSMIFIFCLQVFLALIAAVVGSFWIIKYTSNISDQP
jgi:magnesium-transporting ATPase (P-type)